MAAASASDGPEALLFVFALLAGSDAERPGVGAIPLEAHPS